MDGDLGFVSVLIYSPRDNSISFWFLIGILIVLFCATLGSKYVPPFRSRFVNNIINMFGSNAIVTLPVIGILGTFLGVLVAVSNFDISPDNAVHSLQEIILGLKTALSTSIYGLGGSIIVRFASNITKKDDSEKETSLQDILSAIHRGQTLAREDNQRLIATISGENDGSLNGQIRLMRQDLNDFAKTVAEANTKAFIEALEKAINDFNKNLTEQFGENFAQLNKAVGKLLEWQENNKKDMDELRSTLDMFANVTKKTSESLEKIENSTESIPKNIEGLSDLLRALEAQTQDMQKHLKAFAEVAEQAKSAVPDIKNILTEYTDGLKTSLETITNQMKSVADEQEKNFTALSKRYQGMADITDKLAEAMENILRDQKQSTEELKIALKAAVGEFVANFNEKLLDAGNIQDASLKEFEQQLGSAFGNSMGRIEDLIENYMKTSHEQTQKQIEAEMQALASYLGAISKKIAEDYVPLVEQIRKIVELGKGVQQDV